MSKVAVIKGVAIKIENRLIDKVINIMAQDKGWDTKLVEHTEDMSFPLYILFYRGYTHTEYVKDQADIDQPVSHMAIPECVSFNILEDTIPKVVQPVMLNNVAVEFHDDEGIKVPYRMIDTDTLKAIVLRKFGIDLDELLEDN